jgi:UDP-glucose 4-epimerase
MNEMKNMISIMLGKMFIIETMLQKAPITNEPNLSQVPTVSKRNKAPVSEQKTVAMSPYSQSKSSSNYILLDSDDDELCRLIMITIILLYGYQYKIFSNLHHKDKSF